MIYQSSSQPSLILLGTGTPNPDPERQGAGYLVLVDGQVYLFDFGPGIVRQAAGVRARYPELFPGFSVRKLSRAFLTHLHADHTMGLADLLLTPWILGRDHPLEIFGPPGTAELVRGVQDAYSRDIHYRLSGLEPANPRGWKAQVTEIQQGEIYRDPWLSVTAFPVQHGEMPDCFGFRVAAGGRVIVFSGDTRPCDNLLRYGKQADILVHEVYSARALEKRPQDWQTYHRAHHTSTVELAEAANQLQPGLLILTHALFWGTSEEQLLSEIKEGYQGKVVIGSDLDLYQL